MSMTTSRFLARAALMLLTTVVATNCAEIRPALTPDGKPDPSRRMAVKGWRLEATNPTQTVIFTFAYPAETSFFFSESLSLKGRLHQYRLEAIETGIFPRLTVTDLDTKKKMILTQDKEVNGVRIFTELPLDPPAPAPVQAVTPLPAPVIEPTPPPRAELPPVPATPIPPLAPAPLPAPQQ